MQRKYPTLKPPGKERCVRFKTLGKQYTPEVIRMRILYPRRKVSAVENRQAGPRVRYTRLRTHGRPVRGFTGLRALYYRYLYELGALPKKPVYPGYAVRQDIRKLDQYVEQMRFLLRHGIDTVSYTHLDVYKRQMRNTFRWASMCGKASWTVLLSTSGGWAVRSQPAVPGFAMHWKN